MSVAPKLAGVSAVKLALMAKELRAQTQQALQADPIAIVGMACRVPGGANTPEAFWRILADGIDTIREVPADRWDANAWHDADPSAAAKSITRQAGFLDRIDGFDADYFGILPREAERMDPQQRVFMEAAIDALDDAGLTRARLAGSRTGVFIASYHNDYTHLQYADVEAIDARTLTGTLHSVLANRLSYFLDLHGPSLSIDTACSSSLVAIHLACQSLRFGESDTAIAGGVSLIVAPELMVSMSKVGFMAPDGRCKTFDETANGFGRGEGCGLVVLRRLSDAIADGDRILAIVRGSAVNQDGHSTLLAAPHGPAQEALIREALRNAQLEPSRIGYVEAHGTGTALGDPIEVEAIAAALGRIPAAGPCLLGSAKANLGHLEAAAGVIGLIKSVLALCHEAIPPQVHFRKLSPHISLAGTRLSVPTALVPWPASAVPRCAAVSSFGVGGTNAHVIVEEAPRLSAPANNPLRTHPHVLLLSAQNDAALLASAQRWIDFLSSTPETIGDVCATAAQRRTHFDRRLAVVADTKKDLAARLRSFASDGTAAGLVTGHRAGHVVPRIAFVFSGQGPQWFAMGRELLASEPVFRDTLETCDRLLRPLAGWSLLEELARSEADSRLDQTMLAQPALFALQVALVALWRSWGVRPDTIVGHSVGEIAALHTAGVLDLPSAVRVVWHRGRIMQRATGLGRMASVGLTEREAIDLVRGFGERLSIGAVNGPRSVVLSGECAALDSALASLAQNAISHRVLPVQYAFHSAQMTPFQAELSRELAGLRTNPPDTAVYSTVTGALADARLFEAAYFGRNIREPVRFAAAIQAMADDGCNVFLEIGPHPVLASAIDECLAARDPRPSIVASLRRGRPEFESMLHGAASIHVAGIDVDWGAIQGDAARIVTLPPYPWQHKRYWIRPRPSHAGTAPSGERLHPLLGIPIATAGITARLFAGDSASARSWLSDHRIFGRVLFPAAAAIETLLAAASRVLGTETIELQGFTMHRPLALSEDDADPTRWQVVVEPQESMSECEVSFYHRAAAGSHVAHEWTRIASARALSADDAAVGSAAIAEKGEAIEAAQAWTRFAELGVAFGPAFRALASIERGEGWARAGVTLPQPLASSLDRYGLHPVLLDAGLQLCSLAAPRDAHGALPAAVYLPIGVDRIVLRRTAPHRLLACAELRDAPRSNAGSLTANVTLQLPDGRPMAMLEGARFVPASASLLATEQALPPLYEVAWASAAPLADAANTSAAGLWLLFCDGTGVGEALAERVQRAGGRCARIRAGAQYAQHAELAWTIDPAEPHHFVRLLGESGWATADRGAVVHSWNLDLPLLPSDDASAAEANDARGTASVMHLAQALARAGGTEQASLLIVTRGARSVSGQESASVLCPRAAGAWGLSGVIALEHPEVGTRMLDLDPSATAPADVAHALLDEALRGSSKHVAVRGGHRFSPLLRRYSTKALRTTAARPHRSVARQAKAQRPGTFDGIGFGPLTSGVLATDAVRVRVEAAGLNFRDVLLALGMYPGADIPLGAECAGVVTEVGRQVKHLRPGDAVFGYASASLADEVIVPEQFLARLPAGMSFTDAAALPVAFLTAQYGLHTLAALRPGERVLIHAATGGVGMAAVQLALRRGAQVFATAGSERKRALLRSMGATLATDSRSLAFADEVLRATDGEGVHVVLNSLAGDFIPASLRTLARGGRFLELGKRDAWTAEAVAQRRPDVHYHRYDLGAEAEANRALLPPMLEDLLAALADGSVRPLPVTVFEFDELHDAMRYMAQARHTGKIVLRVGPGTTPAGADRIRIHPAGTYWVTGGLGALGLATARWLVTQGARYLVLSGRRMPESVAQAAVRELERQGATVKCVAVDAADVDGMRAVLDDIQVSGAPLRGVVHAAGVLQNGVLLEQRWPSAREALRGKAHGAWVLHEITRDLKLDFFVLYSAAGVLLGAAGQGLYPAANAQLDALAQARRRLGLPALSVAWGAWAGAGMAARQQQAGHDVWAARGLGQLDEQSAFAHLSRLLAEDAAHVAVLPIDWSRFLAQLPAHVDRAFFTAVAPAAPETSAAVTGSRSGATDAIVPRLQAMPAGQRRTALLAYLTERVLHALGLDATGSIEVRAALKDMGLDSLMAVELRNALQRVSPQPLPVTLLFDHPTLDTLATYLMDAWKLVEHGATPSKDPAAPLATDSRGVVGMTDDEAQAALLAELERGTTGAAS